MNGVVIYLPLLSPLAPCTHPPTRQQLAVRGAEISDHLLVNARAVRELTSAGWEALPHGDSLLLAHAGGSVGEARDRLNWLGVDLADVTVEEAGEEST